MLPEPAHHVITTVFTRMNNSSGLSRVRMLFWLSLSWLYQPWWLEMARSSPRVTITIDHIQVFTARTWISRRAMRSLGASWLLPRPVRGGWRSPESVNGEASPISLQDVALALTISALLCFLSLYNLLPFLLLFLLPSFPHLSLSSAFFAATSSCLCSSALARAWNIKYLILLCMIWNIWKSTANLQGEQQMCFILELLALDKLLSIPPHYLVTIKWIKLYSKFQILMLILFTKFKGQWVIN